MGRCDLLCITSRIYTSWTANERGIQTAQHEVVTEILSRKSKTTIRKAANEVGVQYSVGSQLESVPGHQRLSLFGGVPQFLPAFVGMVPHLEKENIFVQMFYIITHHPTKGSYGDRTL